MKIVNHVLRVVLGLLLVAGGAFYFSGKMPNEVMPGIAGEFTSALLKSGLFGFVKFLELAAGLMLLAGFQVPLALLIWFPLNVVIVYFHIFMAPFSPIPLVLMAVTFYLAWVNKNHFAQIFSVRNAWKA